MMLMLILAVSFSGFLGDVTINAVESEDIIEPMDASTSSSTAAMSINITM